MTRRPRHTDKTKRNNLPPNVAPNSAFTSLGYSRDFDDTDTDVDKLCASLVRVSMSPDIDSESSYGPEFPFPVAWTDNDDPATGGFEDPLRPSCRSLYDTKARRLSGIGRGCTDNGYKEQRELAAQLGDYLEGNKKVVAKVKPRVRKRLRAI